MAIEAKALITANGHTNLVRLSPLQTAQIAAEWAGFQDVDVRDNDPGNYTIVAIGPQKTITAKGTTMIKAVEKLMDLLGWARNDEKEIH